MYVWRNWTSNASTNNGSSATTTVVTDTTVKVWHNWVAHPDSSYTNSSVAVTVWATWQASSTNTCVGNYYPPYPRYPPAAARTKETEEQKQERIKRARVAAIKQEIVNTARAHMRKVAEEKAEKLLKDYLTEEQKAQYEKEGRFLVETKSGRVYRIDKGSHGNVHLVDKAHPEASLISFCIQPPNVPAGDAMLAQKLLLLVDEDTFIRIANLSPKYANNHPKREELDNVISLHKRLRQTHVPAARAA